MSWTAAIPLLSKILNLAIKVWRGYKKRRDYAKRQKQAKKIARNPARAMSDHFPGSNNGLRESSGDADNDNAEKAGKTDDSG